MLFTVAKSTNKVSIFLQRSWKIPTRIVWWCRRKSLVQLCLCSPTAISMMSLRKLIRDQSHWPFIYSVKTSKTSRKSKMKPIQEHSLSMKPSSRWLTSICLSEELGWVGMAGIMENQALLTLATRKALLRVKLLILTHWVLGMGLSMRTRKNWCWS